MQNQPFKKSRNLDKIIQILCVCEEIYLDFFETSLGVTQNNKIILGPLQTAQFHACATTVQLLSLMKLKKVAFKTVKQHSTQLKELATSSQCGQILKFLQ